MDPTTVLKQYLCCSQFGSLLSKNTAIDWYGKTIKTGPKIEQFYKYEISGQYSHCFSMAVSCAQFEYKPAHFETMKEPMENFMNNINIDVIKTNDSYQTPMSTTHETQQTKNSSSSIDEIQTPLRSKSEYVEVKPKIYSFESPKHDISQSKPWKRKLYFDTPEHNHFYADRDDANCICCSKFRKKSSNDCIEEQRLNKQHELNQCESSSLALSKSDQLESNYSELYYIEAIGVMKTIYKTKYCCINNNSSNCSIDFGDSGDGGDSNSNPINNQCVHNSGDDWDRMDTDDYYTKQQRNRETKLKISYRISKQNKNDIQIALIIYEDLNKKCNAKRNLMSEYDEFDVKSSSPSSPSSSPSTSTTSSTVSTVPEEILPLAVIDDDQGYKKQFKIKKKIQPKLNQTNSLRRLRF